MANFTHLHVHTCYSLLDGAAKIPELVSRAKELGFDSLAITDHGVMYGCIDFYRECRKQGIKPIIGCEVYVAPGSRFDREHTDEKERYYHLILLAENNEGYENLSKIVSLGFIDGFYYKPRVDKEVIQKYHNGIICLSACLQGEVAFYLRRGLYDTAKKTALEYMGIFGDGNYFLEMQDHGYSDDHIVNQGVMRLHEETKIPVVCTNDSHYIKAEDAEAHDVLLCIQTGAKVNDENRMRYEGGQYYLKSEDEMRHLFPYAAEACDNTYNIAQRCNVEIKFGEYKIPHYDVPDEYSDAYEYLKTLCDKGIESRYGNPVPEDVEERLLHELDVIKKMGFVDYFLIVWDYVNYARSEGIPVAPGRGSAAGSIISYALRITDIDPIGGDLLFERFLNPERVTMPDIDIDFSDTGRQKVIDYVTNKYGKECVAGIIAFGTLKARNVIRDVGRVLDFPYATVDAIAKSIPASTKISLHEALEISQDFKKFYESSDEIKYLVDIAEQLEGIPRQVQVHPSGVVIGGEPIGNFVPLCENNDVVCTQYVGTTVENLGLLKMDFLGSKIQTVIENTLKSIKLRTGEQVDIEHVSRDDSKVFTLLSRGDCDGVFQLESGGMQNFMKQLKPKSLEDMVAGISLYRPGPMDYIPKYINGKEHQDEVTYETPELEPILAPTYGCIVYQEQVMQIVMKLAGYSMGRADLVRRAMAKKHPEEMAKERKNFVYGSEELGVPGCLKNGVSEKAANTIFDSMEDFASYAFNKSHAASYAVVAYETAWLKTYYPKDFMASLLTSFRDSQTRILKYIEAARRMGIKMLPPDVNEGDGNFTATDDGIRYGLSGIKSIGDNVVSEIVAEREKNGKFSDLQDFCTRMTAKEANKRCLESFIMAGAFDSFGKNRRQMMMVYPDILETASREKKENISGQMSLLDFINPEAGRDQFKVKYPEIEEFPKDVCLKGEKDILGVYISGHPLDGYRDVLKVKANSTAADFQVDEEDGRAEAVDNAEYTIGGLISQMRIILTKKNENMAFVTLEDLTGTVEIVVFPRVFEKYRNMLTENNAILVSGRAQVSEREAKILASDICSLQEASEKIEAENSKLWILFSDKEEFIKREKELEKFIENNPGYTDVYCKLNREQQAKKMNKCINADAVMQLEKIYGKEKVRLVIKKD